jgi:hypothetical protein
MRGKNVFPEEYSVVALAGSNRIGFALLVSKILILSPFGARGALTARLRGVCHLAIGKATPNQITTIKLKFIKSAFWATKKGASKLPF